MDDLLLVLDNTTDMIDAKVTYSRGVGKKGKMFAYVRPLFDCFNKSRRVGAFTNEELEMQINKCIEKHFAPIKKYLVDGREIGSNSEKGALKEYWRVCEVDKIKKEFIVQEVI